MGMGTSSGPGQVKSDINVTPLVDVVLVLLIIFLITMPVVMRTVTLEVPRKADDTEDHVMHAEWGRIEAATADRLNAARAAGGRYDGWETQQLGADNTH